jgi:hypothetical protein
VVLEATNEQYKNLGGRENFISDLLKSQERSKISFNGILEEIFLLLAKKKIR